MFIRFGWGKRMRLSEDWRSGRNLCVMEVFEFRSDGRSGEMVAEPDILVEVRGFDCQKIGEVGEICE